MDNEKDISYENQKITPVHMEKEVRKSFIDYAMSVIVSRALPDVRDGLKPVHRRILYAMYEDNLTYDKPFCKSATTVGNVLGRYHPHGDAAVYDSMVRLAQPFAMRYPMIEGHGNFGNVDGDGAAAYRYTEARMSKIADEMLRDIEKDVVPFMGNFDNRRREPVVLPSRIPNLLVNGAVGIAVGMATNVPPHNLGEVIDGVIYLASHPDATVPELMQFIKGPDFPTSAIICGTSGIYAAYMTGKGKITVRARAEVNEDKRRIVVTEIPYQVNKAQLVESIADLVKDKRVEGITALRDESGKAGMKIVIEYNRQANGQIILNQLYKYSQLQDTCAVNMIALVDGEPKLLGLKEILHQYLKHQEQVIYARTRYDLEKAKLRMHILEGQSIALDNIDEVIRLIRGSQSVNEAKVALIDRFGLTDVQAQAIVEMTLGKLAGLERFKIEEELGQKKALIAEFEAILASETRALEIVCEELTALKQKYGDKRRTEIVEVEDDIILEDLIEKHECIITLSADGYIKRNPADSFSAQRRGGKGIIGMTTKEEDDVRDIFAVHSHSTLMLFTNYGKVHTLKAYQIPEASRTSKGTNAVNLIDMRDGEKITAMISVKGSLDREEFFVMVTKQGVIKRASASEFIRQRKGGKIAINLDEGDELLFVLRTSGESDLMIASSSGKMVRFNESAARVMGRTARGVRAMKLKEGECVVGATIPEEGKKLLTITERGFGKRADFELFSPRGRGASGMYCHRLTEKTGALAGIASVSEDDEILIITAAGIIIRVRAGEIPVYGGNLTSGVIVMRLPEDMGIVGFTVVRSQAGDDEPEEAVSEETVDGDGGEDYNDGDGTVTDAESEDETGETGDGDEDI